MDCCFAFYRIAGLPERKILLPTFEYSPLSPLCYHGAMSRFLIIGASRGIGEEVCKQLHSAGHLVTATCRRPNSAQQPYKMIAGIDMADETAPSKLVQELNGEVFDVVRCMCAV